MQNFSATDRYRSLLTAAFIGSLIFLIQYVSLQPDTGLRYHGVLFGKLSLSPFDFSEPNPARFRLLGPILGYVTGLRGNLFMVLPWISAWLFCIVCMYVLLRSGLSLITSVSGASLVCISGLIIFPLLGPGYTDSITWLLLISCLIPGTHASVVAVLLLAAVFNHESAIFAWPGIIGWIFRNRGIRELSVWMLKFLLPGLAIYLLFRWWISTQVEVKYGWAFYLSKWNIVNNLAAIRSFWIAGSLSVFKFAWLLVLLAVVMEWHSKSYNTVLVLLLMAGAPFLQLLMAYDVSRLVCLAFPAVIMSLVLLKRHMSERLSLMVTILTILNVLTPFYIIGSGVFKRVVLGF